MNPTAMASVPTRAIRNARVVLRDEVFAGSVAIEHGAIHAVDSGAASVGEDWEGDYLLPGLVELHTDNLEKHLMPRPGVRWDETSALLVHDAQCAAAGITTVFDAITIGDRDFGGVRSATQHTAIEAVRRCSARALLRIAHRLHLRCEVAAPDVVGIFERYAQDPLLGLASVMDHTPGQRQWQDLGKYRQYMERNGRHGDETFRFMVETLKENQARYADQHRRAIVERARATGIALASHDDSEPAHVRQAHDEGIALSEFPTTRAAAGAARELGIGIVMGAPNLVQGGSHSGNVSASELADEDLLDVLSSDYVPASLLQAAFLLHADHGWGLPKAVATVTATPAHAAALNDRGRIAAGQRADLIRVRVVDGLPVVLQTIVGGARVA
jgi:alpha-D-ribose 1-methylphosphonate 5-triphosphate diphosphatase